MNSTDNTIENIGHKIKYYRNLNKVSLSKLAKEANISKSTLFGLEEGRSNPTISTLINISKTLNIKLNELIGDSKQNSNSVALTLITDTNNNQLYKLSLLANEIFTLKEDIYSDITITLLDGELLYIDQEKILTPKQLLNLKFNSKLKAGKNGAVALININRNTISNYIEDDIFIDKATTENIEALSYMAQSTKAIRAICSSIYPVEHPQKIENVQILEIQEQKELHYYFISTLLGLVGGVSNLLKELKLKPTKQITDILSFLQKANTQEMLSNRDFQNLPKNPIEFLTDELKTLISNNYSNCKILQNADKLNRQESSNSDYILIIDELIVETEQNLIDSTILIDIYREVELLIQLKEQELTNEELEFYIKIRERLSKALYFAKNGYKTLAINEIEKVTKITNISTSHNAMQLYIEALNKAQTTVENKDKLKSYTSIYTLEKKIADFNLEIIFKQNLHPSINNSGKYLYLLKCN